MNARTHPQMHDIPIGIRAAGMRRETDSMGEIEVPADRYQMRCRMRIRIPIKFIHSAQILSGAAE